jgi:hypothetical protein
MQAECKQEGEAMLRTAITGLCVIILSAGSALALESGLEKDATITSFNCKNVAGPYKGQDLCLT